MLKLWYPVTESNFSTRALRDRKIKDKYPTTKQKQAKNIFLDLHRVLPGPWVCSGCLDDDNCAVESEREITVAPVNTGRGKKKQNRNAPNKFPLSFQNTNPEGGIIQLMKARTARNVSTFPHLAKNTGERKTFFAWDNAVPASHK